MQLKDSFTPPASNIYKGNTKVNIETRPKHVDIFSNLYFCIG